MSRHKVKAVKVVYPEGVYVNPEMSLWRYIFKNKWLYILLIPAILYLIIFNYLPMLGIVIAFQKFNMVKGIFNSDFIGFTNFKLIFQEPQFYLVFKNSIILSFYNLIFGFPAPVIMAILLNEVKHTGYKRISQTIYYLPHFISWVVIAGMIMNYLSSSGMFNYLIVKMGGEPVRFLMEPKYFRTIMVFANIWKSAGWNTIIYLAAVSNIDQQIYEASYIDGANRFQRILYITLPGILSTVVIMLILNMGNILSNGFEQVFLLQNSLNLSVSDVFETYTYRLGLMLGQYSFSAAVGLFKSVVGFILIMTTNAIARALGEKGLW